MDWFVVPLPLDELDGGVEHFEQDNRELRQILGDGYAYPVQILLIELVDGGGRLDVLDARYVEGRRHEDHDQADKAIISVLLLP